QPKTWRKDRFLADHSDKLVQQPRTEEIHSKGYKIVDEEAQFRLSTVHNMAADPKTSKVNLVNALYPEGDHFFVVCTTGDSLYSAPRTSIFCSQHRSTIPVMYLAFNTFLRDCS
ncbi:hypothetical protein OSTOST_06271, partial [Ostertagia ostertagi]